MRKFNEQAAAIALMESADPRSDTFAIMSRSDPANPFRIVTDRITVAGTHIVLSDWKDMPNVLDALGIFADGKIGLSGGGSNRDVLVLSPDVCTKNPLAQDALDYLTSKCGWEILLDEREDDAPVSIVPGTFSRNKVIGSHWYEFDIAEISCSLPRGQCSTAKLRSYICETASCSLCVEPSIIHSYLIRASEARRKSLTR